MKELTPTNNNNGEGAYWPVQHEGGRITCSCGRELEQVDETTYRCSAGWPYYRMEDGDIIKDKFGNLLLKGKEH